MLVATVYPLADMLEQIVGDWAEVIALPSTSGGAAATTQPQAAVALLDRADAVLAVGDGSDDGVLAAIRDNGERPGRNVIIFTELTKLQLNANGAPINGSDAKRAAETMPATQPGPEPSHRMPWLDMLETHRFLAALPSRLERHFPGLEAPLRNRTRLYRANLAMVQQDYSMRLARSANLRVAAIGEGIDTLPRGLGLAVVSYVDLSPRDGAASLDAMVGEIREHQAGAVWIDEALPESVATELGQRLGAGVSIVRLDAFGGKDRAGRATYFELMLANLNAIAEAEAKKRR